MRVSTKGRYGLRIMIELAVHHDRGPMPVEAIATNQSISAKYIHILATSLRSAGLLRSVRGPNGGYALARKPSAITALEVVTALEGRIIPAECIADPLACPRQERCVARDVWSEVASAVDGVLAGLTLAQLAARQRARLGQPVDYQI